MKNAYRLRTLIKAAPVQWLFLYHHKSLSQMFLKGYIALPYSALIADCKVSLNTSTLQELEKEL